MKGILGISTLGALPNAFKIPVSGYDMKNGPCEMKNLAGDGAYSKMLEQHRQYLEDFCQKYGDDFSASKT